MLNNFPRILFMLAALLVLSCGDIIEPIIEPVEEQNINEINLAKQLGIKTSQRNGKLLGFTPVKDKMSFETIFKNKSVVFTRITGVEDMVISLNGSTTKYLINNDINEIVIYQVIKNGKPGIGRILHVQDHYNLQEVFGNGFADWYASLSKAFDGECVKDEDCTDAIPPGYYWVCEEGVCRGRGEEAD